MSGSRVAPAARARVVLSVLQAAETPEAAAPALGMPSISFRQSPSAMGLSVHGASHASGTSLAALAGPEAPPGGLAVSATYGLGLAVQLFAQDTLRAPLVVCALGHLSVALATWSFSVRASLPIRAVPWTRAGLCQGAPGAALRALSLAAWLSALERSSLGLLAAWMAASSAAGQALAEGVLRKGAVSRKTLAAIVAGALGLYLPTWHWDAPPPKIRAVLLAAATAEGLRACALALPRGRVLGGGQRATGRALRAVLEAMQGWQVGEDSFDPVSATLLQALVGISVSLALALMGGQLVSMWRLPMRYPDVLCLLTGMAGWCARAMALLATSAVGNAVSTEPGPLGLGRFPGPRLVIAALAAAALCGAWIRGYASNSALLCEGMALGAALVLTDGRFDA